MVHFYHEHVLKSYFKILCKLQKNPTKLHHPWTPSCAASADTVPSQKRLHSLAVKTDQELQEQDWNTQARRREGQNWFCSKEMTSGAMETAVLGTGHLVLGASRKRRHRI